MRKFVVTTLCLKLWFGGLLLAGTNDVETAQNDYLAERAKVEVQHSEELKNIKDIYLVILGVSKDAAESSKDAAQALAFRNEIEILGRKAPLPGVKPNAAVQKLKAGYLKQVQEKEKAMAEKEAALRKTLFAALNAQQKKHANNKEAKAAEALKKEVERLSGMALTKPLSFLGKPKGIPPQFKANTLFYLGFENSPEPGVAKGDGPKSVAIEVKGKPVYEAGPSGLAIKLSKAPDHIWVKPFPLGKDITMSGWVRYEQKPFWGHIIKMSDKNKQAEIAIYTGPNGENMMATASGRGRDNTSFATKGTVELNAWVHVVMTCDRFGLVRLYKNGKLLRSVQRPVGVSPHQRQFIQIGRDLDEQGVPATNGTYGLIDEVLVLDKALDADEVAKLYTWFGGKSVPRAQQ